MKTEPRAGDIYEFKDLDGKLMHWLSVFVSYTGTYNYEGYLSKGDKLYKVTDDKGKVWEIGFGPKAKAIAKDLPDNAILVGRLNAAELSRFEHITAMDNKFSNLINKKG